MTVPDMGGTWCSCDRAQVATMYADDAVRHQVAWPEAVFRGRDEIAAAVGGLFQAVPDTQVTIERVTDGGNGVVVLEWRFTGTHTNDAEGWPAANEAVDIPGVSVCEMRDGLIVKETVYWDSATFMNGAGMLDRVYG